MSDETVQISARIPRADYDLLARRAKANDRSVSGEIRMGLRAYLATIEKAADDALRTIAAGQWTREGAIIEAREAIEKAKSA